MTVYYYSRFRWDIVLLLRFTLLPCRGSGWTVYYYQRFRVDSVPEVQVGRWVQDSVLLQYIQVGAGECTVTRGSRGCRTVYLYE